MTRLSVACLVLAAALGVAVPAARAQAAPLPARLPADTVFYLYSRGTRSISPTSRNPLARLWDDPGFAPARRILEQALLDRVAQNPHLARIPQRDLDALLARPAVFGVRFTEKAKAKGGPESVARGFLVAEPGPKAAAEIRAELLRSDPRAAARMRLTTAGFLVYSEDPATLRLLAARFGATAPAASRSLAARASYRESLAELRGSPTLQFFLRVPALAELHPQVRAGFDTGAFLRTLRVDRVHLACGSVDLNAPMAFAHFAILGNTAAGGPFDFFGPNVASFPTLAAAPASASYVVSRLDFGAALTLVSRAVSAAMPKGRGSSFQTISGLLSTSVIPALGGEYASITPRPGQAPLFAVTVHTKAAATLFGSTLAPFLDPDGAQGPIHYYRFGGRAPSSAPRKGKASSSPAHERRAVTAFLALTPHLLLLSRNRALVRGVARAVTSARPPAGLASVAAFRAARASMPARLSGFSYMNLRGIDWTKLFARGAARAAREGKDPRAARRAAALAKWARDGGSAVLARHLHLLVSGSWKDARGVHWRGDLR